MEQKTRVFFKTDVQEFQHWEEHILTNMTRQSQKCIHSKPQKIIRNQNNFYKYAGSGSALDVCGYATMDGTFGATIDLKDLLF